MAVTMQQFVQQVADAGIATAEELRGIAQSLPAQPASADSSSVRALAQELIQRQRLTEYQAKVLCSGAKGLTIGSYVILDEIGSGGMGTVFKAQHLHMRRLVALKVLSDSTTESVDSIQRFRREVQAAARLNHPNIVTAFDANEQDGIHYLVMEYVDGPNLAKVATAGKPLPVSTTVNYILQAARGLSYAHQQSVVHRDIKPSNLLLDSRGTVKILDLGLARVVRSPGAYVDSSSRDLTRAGQVIGTIDYMAPEQAEDSRLADARSDMYSLGCTWYFLLTREPPYSSDTLARTLLAHHNAAIPMLIEKRHDVRLELDNIFRRMMAKKPEHRYQSLDEVIRALEAWEASHPPSDSGVFGGLVAKPSSGIGSRKPGQSPADAQLLNSDDDFILQEDADRLKDQHQALPKATPTQQLIAVHCNCGRRLLVTVKSIGMKVMCPDCGGSLTIPKPEPETAPAAAAGRSAAMPSAIDVHCQCGQRFAAKLKLAGKTVKCTKCGRPLKIPDVPELLARSPELIEVVCQCGRRLKAGSHLAGKRVKCPACSGTVSIPQVSAPL